MAAPPGPRLLLLAGRKEKMNDARLISQALARI